MLVIINHSPIWFCVISWFCSKLLMMFSTFTELKFSIFTVFKKDSRHQAQRVL